ncbi:SSS family solute:Na+ symporter [Aequitasia blattaphilus]|uniref:Sodium:solute symporter family protein n=1 Tax=Aequitasia blattaphilus TaxID=2949332 RepID=A0ABT1EAS8_9FIRM|nr:sodium:solute symporter family protein [Aequitasia blattaphilus]MCP1102938.1 sodium:solute symporter family protein [Aequitasia blattaphilus]MCR8615578.1 sodium:solute symporter family protein [Aequitasia blattaphilus]
MWILIAVLLYEVISIGGVSLYILNKEKKEKAKEKTSSAGQDDDFMTSGRSMSSVMVGVSLALAILGAVHVFGIMEMAWNIGAASIWFSIAHVTTIAVICLFTGRWLRRMKVNTVPELIQKLFGKRIAIIVTCIVAGQTFAILTMEVQALGIIFNTLTFNSVSIQTGTVIGGLIGIFYVIVAGMKEVGYVNMINTVVMYIGLALGIIFLSSAIPGGWDFVETYYTTNNMEHMINIMGGPGIFVTFGISNIIAVTFAQGISQMGLQSTTAAKNSKTIRKALWIAAPVNGIFGIFTMAMGVAAKALYNTGSLEIANESLAAKTAGATMLLQYLPGWLVAWLLASFLGAVLSTFAITTMSMGTLFANNIYTLKDPNVSGAQKTKITRIFIVISGIVAMGVSSFLPEIVNGANWAFAWLIPLFFNVIYGMFWKRNRKAAGATFGIAWVCVLLWTYTPVPAMLGLTGVPLPYVTLAVSLVGGIILNLVIPGGSTGYFKTKKSTVAVKA